MNSMKAHSIRIFTATEGDFSFIKEFIQQFDLDNRDLHYHQFIVAKINNDIIGFGRIRKHKGCDEFCSLGVLEPYRQLGVAKLLIEARIKLATQPIYMCCIIPQYFEKMGFQCVTEYPAEMLDKLNYCTNSLVVEESYVVMKYAGTQ